MKRLLQRIWLYWKFRNIDPSVCCCGETLGTGGSICYHGGCLSAKEYIISKKLEKEER
jgi:hypothetical protein